MIKEPTYKIYGSNLLSSSYSGTFKYLGIKLNPNGKTSINSNDLQDIIDCVKRAPLKPFKKLGLTRSNVIPSFSTGLYLERSQKDTLLSLTTRFVHLWKIVWTSNMTRPSHFSIHVLQMEGLDCHDSSIVYQWCCTNACQNLWHAKTP